MEWNLQYFLAMSFFYELKYHMPGYTQYARGRYCRSQLSRFRTAVSCGWLSDWRIMGSTGVGIARAFRLNLSYKLLISFQPTLISNL